MAAGWDPIIISGKSKSGVLAGRWQMLCYKVLSYQHRPMSGTPKQPNEALQTTFQSTKSIRGRSRHVWLRKSKNLKILAFWLAEWKCPQRKLLPDIFSTTPGPTKHQNGPIHTQLTTTRAIWELSDTSGQHWKIRIFDFLVIGFEWSVGQNKSFSKNSKTNFGFNHNELGALCQDMKNLGPKMSESFGGC